jgi:hypothetical protein
MTNDFSSVLIVLEFINFYEIITVLCTKNLPENILATTEFSKIDPWMHKCILHLVFRFLCNQHAEKCCSLSAFTFALMTNIAARNVLDKRPKCSKSHSKMKPLYIRKYFCMKFYFQEIC